MYSKHLDHPFGEVRGAVADNLRHLSELRLHPSYSSVDVLLKACRESTGRLMTVDAAYESQIDEFGAKLTVWREVRQPSANGTQSYDKAALTSTSLTSCRAVLTAAVLTWIWSSVSDFRISTAFPFITKLLPEFFRMQEILDNDVRRFPTPRDRADMSAGAAIDCDPSGRRRRLPALPGGLDSSAHAPIHRPAQRFAELASPTRGARPAAEYVCRPPSDAADGTVFYFHNIFNLDDAIIAELMDQLCDLLRDPKIEVREAAASTLSGIVRCSQRSAILSLRDRFMTIVRTTKIPRRRNAAGEEVAGYQEALIQARESRGELGA